jgi:hypothetical protein
MLSSEQSKTYVRAKYITCCHRSSTGLIKYWQKYYHKCLHHGIIYYTDTKAKCRHLKKLTCKGILRQVFIRVYRLELQLFMLLFSTQLCKLLPFSPSPWFNSPPFPVWISTLYTCIQCVRRRGYGVLGLRQINICRKVSLQVNVFRLHHFALPSISFTFLWVR